VRDGQKIVVTCTCGQIAHFLPGVLQRLHKLPSDTLVHDLRYRLRFPEMQIAGSVHGDR
jgi:hypothetical protein